MDVTAENYHIHWIVSATTNLVYKCTADSTMEYIGLTGNSFKKRFEATRPHSPTEPRPTKNTFKPYLRA